MMKSPYGSRTLYGCALFCSCKRKADAPIKGATTGTKTKIHRSSLFIFLIFFLFIIHHSSFIILCAHEVSGSFQTETSIFLRNPGFQEQERNSVSWALEYGYYHEFKNHSALTITPFARADSADADRSHFDFREFNYLLLGDTWELRAGIGKVFWGATEFVHLIDIINQTDLVESINAEKKLGQPMINMSIPQDFGVVDIFILPYFRERTFQGKKGRLRSGLEIDTDHSLFESSRAKHHIDTALRYSNTIASCDLGVYYFRGTSRNPTMITSINNNFEPVFVPYYPQIRQAGIDAQMAYGSWLFKLEALDTSDTFKDYFASTGGVEYTFSNISSSGIDLGIIGEWARDERGKSITPYERDMMFGMRLALNDASGTEMLAGMIQDIKTASSALNLEAKRRIGSSLKAGLESWFFMDVAQTDLFYSLRDDDFIKLEM
ncbi:hypothetical protein ACFL6Y_04005, partial [Elusimicrobiota bacterium]